MTPGLQVLTFILCVRESTAAQLEFMDGRALFLSSSADLLPRYNSIGKRSSIHLTSSLSPTPFLPSSLSPSESLLFAP